MSKVTHVQHDAIPQLDSLFAQARELCRDGATGWQATATTHENGSTTLTIETWPLVSEAPASEAPASEAPATDAT